MSNKYVINGVEITYDTFDIDNMDRWDTEIKHVSDDTKMSIPGETPLQRLRRICNTILDFFDAVCGDGTAHQIFGDHVNVKDIYTSYNDFVSQVTRTSKQFASEMAAMHGTNTAGNRAQRRAIEFGKR